MAQGAEVTLNISGAPSPAGTPQTLSPTGKKIRSEGGTLMTDGTTDDYNCPVNMANVPGAGRTTIAAAQVVNWYQEVQNFAAAMAAAESMPPRAALEEMRRIITTLLRDQTHRSSGAVIIGAAS
jgi:hypothetical protein